MTNRQADFYFGLWQIWSDLKRLVSEFEITFENPILKETLSSVQDVYMHEIVITLWMLLSPKRNDQYSLCKLSKFFTDEELNNKTFAILNTFKDLILKLEKNRNWISAHRDIKFLELGYSERFVKNFEKEFEIKATQLRSRDKINERYTPNDMRTELTEIRKILEQVEKIIKLIPEKAATATMSA